MADNRITCITKLNRLSSHEHITHVGNPSEGWKITREQAISFIETRTHTFYVQDSVTGRRAQVGVFHEKGKVPYLKTYADGYWNDNLLSLNTCPV